MTLSFMKLHDSTLMIGFIAHNIKYRITDNKKKPTFYEKKILTYKFSLVLTYIKNYKLNLSSIIYH